ncbi:MAG TPA: undecaprenyl/decaprenyl-phosphate alpha-N-acetylglucosaminyl 1-phosphate transferase, partial [Phormidium sp.]
MPYLYHLIAFLVSAFTVLWTTPIVKKFGLQSGLFDVPDKRKVHQRPMVRLGGVSIFLGTLAALLVVWWSGGFVDAKGAILPPSEEYEIWGVIIGGIAFFLIGLADDLFGLSAFTRLLVEVIVASLAWK